MNILTGDSVSQSCASNKSSSSSGHSSSHAHFLDPPIQLGWACGNELQEPVGSSGLSGQVSPGAWCPVYKKEA